jgi:predicted RNA-binding Zn-ribbon protein involved in translation (DUF1610 family)
MAVELVLRNWCDVCLEAGENTEGETVSVAVGVVPAFDVEVCPRHAKPLAEAVTALAALGRRPGKTGQPGPTRASKGAAGTSSGPSRVTGGACPECGQATNSREALRSHLRREHDKSLADVGLAEARYVCPECGGKFDAGQGFAAHLRAIHNGLTMTDALSRSEQSA